MYLGNTTSWEMPTANLTIRNACGVTLDMDSVCCKYAFSISGFTNVNVINFVLFASSLQKKGVIN